MSNVIYSRSTAVRNAACTAHTSQLDAGAAAGKLKLYNSAETTLLCSITLNDPAFGSPVNGVATLDLTGGLTGTGETGVNAVAAVAHFCDSDDNVHWKASVGATGSGAGVTLSNVTIVEGATVTVTGGTHTEPVGSAS